MTMLQHAFVCRFVFHVHLFELWFKSPNSSLILSIAQTFTFINLRFSMPSLFFNWPCLLQMACLFSCIFSGKLRLSAECLKKLVSHSAAFTINA